MPTTTDELYELFKAFRDEDQTTTEAGRNPMDFSKPYSYTNSLFGAFGLRNRGRSHPNVIWMRKPKAEIYTHPGRIQGNASVPE